jgi:hypothetical protein
MTDEVDTPTTGKTESDWAMAYADERRLRIKAQRRVASFLVNGAALAQNADQLVRSILSSNHATQETVDLIVRTIRDCNDLGHDINLCLFDPIWEITPEEKLQLGNANSTETVPRSYRERTDKIAKQAAIDCRKEWEVICEKMDFNSPDVVAEMVREEFSELLAARMRADRENQSTETH